MGKVVDVVEEVVVVVVVVDVPFVDAITHLKPLADFLH
jgi:hypothetical protein